jgi:DNA mismatch repair protein MutH
MTHPVTPPGSIDELYERAYRLAGRSLSQIARERGALMPADLRRRKGWVGLLLEEALGATGSSHPVPDFPQLGVEMKTLPVDPRGNPRESTYVCVCPLDGSLATRWEASWVRRKLSCVLWIPIVGDAGVPLADRVVGAPVLWQPTDEEEAILRADWEAIAERIHAGAVAQLSARLGRALQLRPKAATSRVMVWTQDEEATWVRVNPRGFYLRTRFTRALLARHLSLPGGD